MNRTRRLRPVRRLACILAGLAAALLGAATAASAALAAPVPPLGTPPGSAPAPAGPAPAPEHLPPLPPGWNKHPPLPRPAHAHAALASGMPGWQITLIAAGAALLAAVLAMIAYRIRATHRRVPAPTA